MMLKAMQNQETSNYILNNLLKETEFNIGILEQDSSILSDRHRFLSVELLVGMSPQKKRKSLPKVNSFSSASTDLSELIYPSLENKKRSAVPVLLNAPPTKKHRLENPSLSQTQETCSVEGCNTKAISGKRNGRRLCKKHGGGRRCTYPDCTKSAQGASKRCVQHGGGKRCIFDNCNKLARGRSNLCIPHGGGKRCSHESCSKLAQGGTDRCIRHGGGKRCSHLGCPKSAIGSSGRCVMHGGGKRCVERGCSRSAIGGGSCCVRHGGRKATKVE
eukprot:snap_masked-scaffold_5-processed-gene-15.27-mRNA-1 protein AED:0.08 eAED:0.08 QI:0/0/0/0.5/1/1/2/0/273